MIDFGRNPFEFKPGEPFATLKLIGDLTPELPKEFEKRIRPQLEGFTGNLVLDLSECGSLHPCWTRTLLSIAAQIKKNGKRIQVVSVNSHHKSFFQDQGVAANFPLVPDLATAAREFAAKKTSKLDVTLINPFLEGTVQVLKKQTGLTVIAGVLAARDPVAPLDGDVSGVIAVESVSFLGSVIISFPEATYLAIITRMLGEGHEAITPENRDGASELTNMIFGYAKRVLNEQGHQLKMALPTVVNGREPSELPAVSGVRIAIPFESEGGSFTVEIRAT